MDIELTTIEKEKLQNWEKDCNEFWNMFYSFLILNDLNLIIKDLNISNQNQIFNDLESFIYKIPQSSSLTDDIINIITKKQEFKINDFFYSVPQNFLEMQLKEENNQLKIVFYYLAPENTEAEIPNPGVDISDADIKICFNLIEEMITS